VQSRFAGEKRTPTAKNSEQVSECFDGKKYCRNCCPEIFANGKNYMQVHVAWDVV
jgi:pyruvate-formate lyase